MKRMTKKELAISLHGAGRSVEEIARMLECSPSYVANCLVASGKQSEYSDLYTSSVAPNAYARMFRGVLRFKDVTAAEQSVERIDALYHQFADANDRRGQHQAQLMALIGKNRAEGLGKLAEARLFAEWLVSHLDTVHVCDRAVHGESGPQEPDDLSLFEATLAFA
jgi:hypothetical protein